MKCIECGNETEKSYSFDSQEDKDNIIKGINWYNQ